MRFGAARSGVTVAIGDGLVQRLMFPVGVCRAAYRRRRRVFPGGFARTGQLAAQKVVEGDKVVILAGFGDGAEQRGGDGDEAFGGDFEDVFVAAV